MEANLRRARHRLFWLTLLLGSLAGIVRAADCCPEDKCDAPQVLDYRWGHCGEACDQEGCDDEDVVRYFGPCPCDERGTLLQWSYGTSFSGGPDLSEALVTDRPDFTESAVTVGRGVAQLEMGYTYTFDDEFGERQQSHSYPETLLRFGMLAQWLEFRVGWNYAEEETLAPVRGRVSGAEDLYLGIKIALTPQEGILPEMALMPQMTVPTGSSAFTADETLPGLNWLYAWEINDTWSCAGSTQLNRARDEVTLDAYVEFAQSFTVGAGLTDRLGAYAEWYAFVPSGADSHRTEHYLNGGFAWQLNNDVQFDVRAGVGLNRDADDYFVGTGLAIRFQ